MPIYLFQCKSCLKNFQKKLRVGKKAKKCPYCSCPHVDKVFAPQRRPAQMQQAPTPQQSQQRNSDGSLVHEFIEVTRKDTQTSNRKFKKGDFSEILEDRRVRD